MIRATICSDDGIVKTEFDATKWFKQAEVKEILELAECGWGGDYRANKVAIYMGDRLDLDVIGYAELAPGVGFEVHVDPDQARAWVAENLTNSDNSGELFVCPRCSTDLRLTAAEIVETGVPYCPECADIFGTDDQEMELV